MRSSLTMTYGSVCLYHGLGHFKCIAFVIPQRHFYRSLAHGSGQQAQCPWHSGASQTSDVEYI